MEGIWGRVQAEMDARQGRKGLTPYDLLELPGRQRDLVKKLLKRRVISLSEAAAELGQSEAEAAQTLAGLVAKTYLIEFEKKGEPHYKLLMARKEGKELPFDIWQDLTAKMNP